MINQIKNQILVKQRIAIIGSAIIGVIAAFLPYQTVWGYSVSLIETRDGTGYIIIITFLISLIVALGGDRQKVMRKGHLAGAIIPGIIPGVLLLLVAAGQASQGIGDIVNYGIGFYLVIIASASILISGLSLKDEPTSLAPTRNDAKIFCSNCGKQYNPSNAGEFCEECGNKL